MKTGLYCLAGGFGWAWIFASLFNFCSKEVPCIVKDGQRLDYWLSILSVLSFLLGIFLFFTFSHVDEEQDNKGLLGFIRYVTNPNNSTDEDIEQVWKEMNDTRITEEDVWNYNENMSSACWWSGGNTYIDFFGNRRSVGYTSHRYYEDGSSENVYIPEHAIVTGSDI